MKRSEILKVMQDAVNQYHLLYSGNPDGYSCNDHILKKLEKAGMLPPKACIERSVRVGDEERIAYHNVHEWEDEG